MFQLFTILLLFTFCLSIIAIIIYRPWVLLRPSVWFSLLFSVTVTGASAFVPNDHIIYDTIRYDDFLNIDTLRVTVLSIPLLVVLFVLATPVLSIEAKQLSVRCRIKNARQLKRAFTKLERLLIVVLLGILGVVLFLYFKEIPLNQTGLWTIIFNPVQSNEAREQSLKLIDSAAVRYGYNWYRLLIVPTLILSIWINIKSKSTVGVVLIVVVTIILLLSASLTGERSSIVFTLFTLSIFYMLLNGVNKSIKTFVTLAAILVPFVAIVSMARSGLLENPSVGSFFDHILTASNRVFVDPLNTGVSTNLYAQENGLLGISSNRPLASITDVPFVDLPHNVAQFIVPNSRIKTGSANTAFIFDFQAAFGLYVGSVISLLLLCSLDFLLFCFRKSGGLVIVVLYGLFLRGIFSLTASSFTTSLSTHGILWIVLAAILYMLVFCIQENPRELKQDQANQNKV